jgi:putative addiction module killer protein
MPRVVERVLLEYQEPDGKIPFREWLGRLKDKRARAAVDARLLRVRLGNFGDAKAIGGGVDELRIHVGPGYRVYFAKDGDKVVLLLIGGDKGTQAKDIKAVQGYWAEYREK